MVLHLPFPLSTPKILAIQWLLLTGEADGHLLTGDDTTCSKARDSRFKNACKPIASRLKKEEQDTLVAVFRWMVINYSSLDEEKAVKAAADLLGELFVFTVAGAAVIFEVQRSSRSEARKEEQRKQELEAMKQKDEDLAREVELLKQKIEELEQLARGRGFAGLFNPRHTHGAEGVKAKSS